MTDSKMNCPKCNAPMERGFVMDHTHGALLPSQWASGDPQRSFWTVTKRPEHKIAIGTFRCTTCGYLESYARPEFDKK
jgi:uncharacterized cupin superfamily protein